MKRRQLQRAKQRKAAPMPRRVGLDDLAHLPREHQAGAVLRGFAGRTMAGRPRQPDLVALAAQAVRLAETGTRVHRDETPLKQPIACGPGCSHCCLVNVRATPPEVLCIAAQIREQFSVDQVAALRVRIDRAIAAAGAGDNARLAATVYCPLLEDDRCLVYDQRPMKCRGVESFDAESCRKGFVEGTPVPHRFDLIHYGYFNVLQTALIDGLADAGYPDAALDLNRALRIALDDPDAGRRWIDGEAVFDPARRAGADGGTGDGIAGWTDIDPAA